GQQPCPVLWGTPMGAFWGRPNDAPLLGGLVLEQLFWSIYQREPVAVREGDVVFDVVSHLGTFSRFALDRGARRVVAFEPEPVNVACYQRTFHQEIAAGR